MILRVASICHHFLWLSVFSWTVVISTDIAKRMLNMKRYTIHQKKTERRPTSNHKNRVTFIIYFKLFFILGLSWIVGIISSNVYLCSF
ncbi:uncharacterized protein LOC127733396 [Mytilus californianus]|uniref:uncharacterized protein LOC127733396 n=1 Tax=Mytilus californianus TaxID=6549 RepID=UPI0022458854|nr:uncharacterized protein LOC127733396 [Mytilus californianus]